MHQMGREKEAIERCRDLLMMSRVMAESEAGAMPHVAKNVSWGAAYMIQQIAIDLKIGDSLAEVSPQDVRRLVAELLDESVMIEARRKAVRWSRASEVDQMRCLGEGIAFKRNPDLSERLVWRLTKPMMMKDGRMVLAHWNQIVSRVDESSDWPTFEKLLEAGTDQKRQAENSPNWHTFARSSMSDYDGPALSHFKASAERRMAAAVLAVRLFAVEQGRLPRNLDELVPAYLPAVPIDPMGSGGQKLKYLADEKRPIIYSVGTNGTDELGSNVMLPKARFDDNWGREDVVVHLKRQPRVRPRAAEWPAGYDTDVQPQ
jgi:hypothetical protein